jgi:hypothetical protein
MTALLSTTPSLAGTELARLRRLTADTIRSGGVVDALSQAQSRGPAVA